MTGTPNQVELAVLIRERVADEFDRVERAFVDASLKQSADDRADTESIVSILDEKRAAVMAVHDAGYFISTWQNLSGKVRETIAADPRFQAIEERRQARRRQTAS